MQEKEISGTELPVGIEGVESLPGPKGEKLTKQQLAFAAYLGRILAELWMREAASIPVNSKETEKIGKNRSNY